MQRMTFKSNTQETKVWAGERISRSERGNRECEFWKTAFMLFKEHGVNTWICATCFWPVKCYFCNFIQEILGPFFYVWSGIDTYKKYAWLWLPTESRVSVPFQSPISQVNNSAANQNSPFVFEDDHEIHHCGRGEQESGYGWGISCWWTHRGLTQYKPGR